MRVINCFSTGILAALLGACPGAKDAARTTQATQGNGKGFPATKRSRVEPNRVDIEAVFDIDRVSGGKRFQGSWLTLPSGKRLVVSYRPIPKYYRFVEKRVIATGHHYTNPPYVQQIGAPHFRLASMRLAPGETPYAVVPQRLPAPPVVTAKAALQERAGRWVTVRAKLLHLIKPKYWTKAILQLSDGTKLSAAGLRSRWAPLVGKDVTVTGFLSVSSKATEPRFRLGRAGICATPKPRCGISEWPRPPGRK